MGFKIIIIIIIHALNGEEVGLKIVDYIFDYILDYEGLLLIL